MKERGNGGAVVASQSEELRPEQNSLESRSRETEIRHETREPDSYFIKEHNKGIDEDHLAKFKPDKKEWKME